MRRSAILAFVLAGLLCGAPGGSASHSARRPPGRIVYSGALEGRGRALFIAAADGSGPTQITAGPDDFSPHWSPDGRRIVFVRSTVPRVTAIWIVGADGTGARPLDEDHPYAEHPRWSPDGSRVAYQVQTSTNIQTGLRAHTTYELWLVRPDGSDRRRLVRGDGDNVDDNPLYSVATGTWAWSPGGRRLAFVYGPEGAERVRIVDVATGKTRPRGHGWDVSWSPDGRRLAVTVDASHGIGEPGCGTVWIVPANGGKRRLLVRPPRRPGGPKASCDLWPRWPTGRSVAFVRSVVEPTRPGRLFTARADGTQLQRVRPLGLARYRWAARCSGIFEYASGYGSGWIVHPRGAAPRFVRFPRGGRGTRCNPDSGACESGGDWHCS
jgi:Tol biopolymer transport system component